MESIGFPDGLFWAICKKVLSRQGSNRGNWPHQACHLPVFLKDTPLHLVVWPVESFCDWLNMWPFSKEEGCLVMLLEKASWRQSLGSRWDCQHLKVYEKRKISDHQWSGHSRTQDERTPGPQDGSIPRNQTQGTEVSRDLKLHSQNRIRITWMCNRSHVWKLRQ